MGDSEHFDQWFVSFAEHRYMHEMTPKDICLAALKAVRVEVEVA